jgi:hypothetical protein
MNPYQLINLSIKMILLISLSCLLVACENNAPKQDINHDKNKALAISAETNQMVSRLQNLVRFSDPMANSFMNDRRLLLMEENADPVISSPNFQSSLNIAYERLRAGNSQDAVQLFNKILIFAESKPHIYKNKAIQKIRSLLAISLMRVGEQTNCIMLHGSDSCIFPLSSAAVHINQQGSRDAMKHYSILLKQDPDDLVSMWLYNIAAQTIGEYPDSVPDDWYIPMSYFKSDIQMSKFINIAPSNGTSIIDLAGGTVTEDFNNDGYLDIMVSAWGTNSQLKLLINDKNGGFIDSTKQAGLTDLMGGLNMVQADYDNDGDVDVLVLRGAWLIRNGRHPNSLLRNEGNGQFTDVTKSSGILSFHPTQTAAWGDFDNDGWLDLYIGNESIPSSPHPGELYHNNGDGSFDNIAEQAGVNTTGFVKGVVWGDYNNDGKLDLYLSRMNGSNQLFENNSTDQQWHFTDVAKQAGVDQPIYSFPTWFWDYNNDGWLDIFVADFAPNAYGINNAKSFSEAQALQIINNYLNDIPSPTYPRLFHNNGDGTFKDVTDQQGLNQPLLAMGANFGDIDNDGYLDMYIGTGAPDFRTIIPNRMFRNNKAQGFQDVTTTTATGHLQKGHGISFGDMDNDGDQDIYAVMGGAYSGDFFQNAFFENPGFNNNWITLQLIGTQSNRSAIGARVELVIQDKIELRHIHRTVTSGGSFGGNSLQLEIGVSQAHKIQLIKIIWPSGRISKFENIKVNQILQLTEGDEKPVVVHLTP